MGEIWRGWRLGVAAALLSACLSKPALAADKDFTLTVEPVFVGTSPGSDLPLLVTITNVGGDAEGEVIVRASGFQMRYPVQLPRGSKKKLTAYVHGVQDMSGVTVELDTDSGGKSVLFQNESFAGMGTFPVVLIADRAGGMSFLRIERGQGEMTGYQQYSDGYVKPANAPERPTGYNNLSAVVLGEGAERLSDASVAALRTWVTLGGTVVFVGGASAPVLNDARWAGMLPVRGGATRTVSSPSLLASIGGSPVKEPVAVMVGEPAEGAASREEAGVAMIVKKPVGLGQTVYLAFNPFEPPVSRWAGRKKLFINAIGLNHTLQVSNWMRNFAGMGDPYSGYRSYSYYEEQSGPFSVKLPPTSTVVMLLLGYFVLVVPLNLILLRVKGKGELAWITSPLISLAFAGIFFTFAGSLYSAELTVAPRGILVVDGPSGEGYFTGQTQIFFPRGGSYDLKMDNLEFITGSLSVEEMYYRGMRSEGGPDTMRVLNASDVGTIKVPNMMVNNLSFHQFSFGQRVPKERLAETRLQFKVTPEGFTASGTIVNTSRYDILGGQLLAGGYKGTIGDIAAGESKKISNVVLRKAAVTSEYSSRYYDEYAQVSLSQFLGTRNVAIFGKLKGYRPGPLVGKLAEQETQISAVVFLSDIFAPERA